MNLIISKHTSGVMVSLVAYRLVIMRYNPFGVKPTTIITLVYTASLLNSYMSFEEVSFIGGGD
jgi:hypothetical protein